jgi:transposase
MLALEKVEITNLAEPAASRWVDDRLWDAIVDSLPHQLRIRARNREKKYRNFLEGVLWVVAEDAFWGELPARYGHWRALYVRFLRWNNIGVWTTVADLLGRDTSVARALMQRADQHAAIVRRRQLRHTQSPWMLEG